MLSNKSLLSLVTGIIIGVLIAPRKGSETQQIISGTIRNISDYIDREIYLNKMLA